MAEQRWRIEPLGLWAPRPVTTDRRSSAVFRASWDDTLRLLLDEADALGRTGPLVLQVAADVTDIRQDGMLRARARVTFPGVVVSFGSRFGPLEYATDAYDQQWTGTLPGWQANVRAIALSLVALRAVDRYGVSRRGEQYTGWRALPSTTLTADEAAALIRAHAGNGTPAGGPVDARMWRRARAAAHPDRHDGARTAWDQVEAAAGVLGLGGEADG
jgi:hypothetical protein